MKTISQNEWIAEYAPNRAFADVGGLWRTVNEKCSVAHEAGARSVAMIDIQEPGGHWWTAFEDLMMQKGITSENKVADAVLPGFAEQAGQYDVVHCSGILYHLPSPYELLANLKKIMREHLIVVSMVVPPVIENEAGHIDLSGGKAIFLPSINDHDKAVLEQHFKNLNIDTSTITKVPHKNRLHPTGQPNYGPWWFLMTPEFIIGMAKTLHLEVIDYGHAWKDRSAGFLFKHA